MMIWATPLPEKGQWSGYSGVRLSAPVPAQLPAWSRTPDARLQSAAYRNPYYPSECEKTAYNWLIAGVKVLS